MAGLTVQGTSDDILAQGTVNQTDMGTPLGLIYQQLKIIALILKQANGITDEDFAMLAAPVPSLIGASIPSTPYQSNTTL